MTALPVNCFTIAGTRPTMEGIPLTEGIGLSNHREEVVVYLGDNCVVPFGKSNGGSRPRRDNTRVLLAEVFFSDTQNKSARLIGISSRKTSIIVHIVSWKLHFDFKPLAEDLNLWPGGDGDIRPFKQFGEHKSGLDKQQLFEIPEGRSILVIDDQRSIVRLTCTNGRPVLNRPTLPDLVEFLCDRARTRRKVQALDWSLYNLRALLKTESEHDLLICNSISELSRLRETA